MAHLAWDDSLRRGWAHVLRWVYAAWLIAQLVYVYDQTHAPQYTRAGPVKASPNKAGGDFCQSYRDLVLAQQFFLIVLVTPAFVAGAVTDEKTRGTLQNLLTAHVTPADIVLGKLAARAAQVGTLALTPLLPLAFVGPVAGIPPEFLVVLLGVTALVLFGLGGVSLLASVWFRQTRSAVIATYGALLAGLWLGGAAVAAGWLPAEWVDALNPVWALRPALDRDEPGEAFRRLGLAAAVWGCLGSVTTAVAVWRLRPAYLRQLEARPRARFTLGRGFARPRPTRDPLAWKERYVGLRVPHWLGVPVVAALAGGITFYAVSGVVAWSAAMGRGGVGIVGHIMTTEGFYALLLATLIVGVRCSGAITGERERQTWDGLMITPLTVEDVVRGKLRGILRSTWPYVLAFWFGAGVVVALKNTDDWDLAVVAVLVGVGLAGVVMWRAPRWGTWVATAGIVLVAACGGLYVALVVGVFLGVTWLAMYFLGAVGLYCSAKSRSSWRSLLGTVALGYAGGFALMCVASPVGCLSAAIVGAIVAMLEEATRSTATSRGPPMAFWELVSVFWAVGTAAVFWLVARTIVVAAETAIAKTDRVAPNWVRMIEFDLPQYAQLGPRRRQRR